MNTRNTFLFAILAVFLLFADHASAQSKVAKTLLNGWDRNKNGLLEKSEIPEVAREKVYSLAKRNGLDTSKALPVANLIAKPGVKFLSENANDKEKVTAKSLPSSEKKARKQGEGAKSNKDLSSTSKSKPSKSGFGVSKQSGKVAGFGKDKQQIAAKENASDTALLDQQEKGDDGTARRRLKFLAKSMLALHDNNKNGKLERNEWSRIRGDLGASDRNRDGILTSEELELHLGAFATQEKDRRALSKSKSASRSRKTPSQNTYRFLTAHERLPKGLPSWFTDRDENLDGQITMREYASRISQAKLDQFRAFDLNNDGFIVPKEYLKSID